MPLHRSISDRAGALALAGVAMLLAGCSSNQPVARVYRGEPAGNQGGAWETVMGTPEVSPFSEWEYARLDDQMNIRTAVEDPASFDDLRRVYLNPRPDQVLYFRRGHRSHRK